jgi:hypothetical protein
MVARLADVHGHLTMKSSPRGTRVIASLLKPTTPSDT